MSDWLIFGMFVLLFIGLIFQWCYIGWVAKGVKEERVQTQQRVYELLETVAASAGNNGPQYHLPETLTLEHPVTGEEIKGQIQNGRFVPMEPHEFVRNTTAEVEGGIG